MTAKEYLSQAFTLHKLITAKKTRIQNLRDMQHRLGGAISAAKVQTSRKPDPLGDITAQLLDSIAECQQDITQLLDIQREIEKVIDCMEREDYRLILYERYINLKRWEDIAADNNFGWDTVHRKHREALEKIPRFMLGRGH